MTKKVLFKCRCVAKMPTKLLRVALLTYTFSSLLAVFQNCAVFFLPLTNIGAFFSV
jgi:hypothetical protein